MMAQLTENQTKLLSDRRIASVATINSDGTPHLTSVWFLYEDESLYLAIPSSSVKGKNLSRDPRIAVMIDVRKSTKESGLTAFGDAEIIAGEEAVPIVRRLHEKYLTTDAMTNSQVGPVFAAMDDIAVKIDPIRWISWDMGELDQGLFGGTLARKGYLKELDP